MANLGLWEPFRELDALRREFDRVLDGAKTGFPPTAYSRVSFLPGRSARTYPLFNMSEDKDTLTVEALAPGINPATLSVTMHRDTLTISGEKAVLNGGVAPDAFHRSERSAGRFTRTIKLHIDVEAEGIKADYKNGLLLVTLPKAEQAKPKSIQVQST
jgi:HSP20 family protein